MALRISAKRVATTLKAREVCAAHNVVSKRQASQATAAASNLSEDTRNDIYVRALVRQSVTCLRCILLESCQSPKRRSTSGFWYGCYYQRASTIYGQNIRATSTNVCEGRGMLFMGHGEQEIPRLDFRYCCQCFGSL
jgi:hypothetical protein